MQTCADSMKTYGCKCSRSYNPHRTRGASPWCLRMHTIDSEFMIFGAGFGTCILLIVLTVIAGAYFAEPSTKSDETLTSPTHTEDTSVSTAPDATDAQLICRMTLLPGREVFSPQLLPCGMSLKLTFAGNCWVQPNTHSNSWKGIDALYTDDESHNFTRRHQKLYIDGQVFTLTPLEEDRAEHRYSIPYEAQGGRLA